MSFEVASGHVSIFPKFASGFGKQIKGELSGAGSDAAKSTGSAFGSHLKAILAGTVITKAVSGISNVFTSALKGGLSRLMGVEEAQAKMRGLGHSAEVAASVVQQAQKAVDGTIYTTAEAATVAASALAAGIKPGQDLDKVLASVANAASTAGVGMDEMGSIYTKVASVGKAQNDSLQRVADRGIPIYQALAEQLGVTTEEVFDMASAGKIGFKEFEEAMTAASGTVAQEMGNTLSGALANTKSAISKIGENLLSGIFPALTPLMLGLREGLKGLQGPALAAGEALGNWLAPKMETLAGHLSNLPGILSGFGSQISTVFGTVKDAVLGFVDGFGGMDAVLQTVSNLAPLLTGPLGLVRTALMSVFSSGGGGIDFAGFASSLGSAIQPVLGALGELAQILTGTLIQAFQTLLPVAIEIGGAFLTLAADLITGLAPVLADLAANLLPIIANLIATLAPVIMGVVDALAPLVAQLVAQIAPAVLNLVTAVLPPLVSIFGLVATAVGQLVTAVAPLVTALVSLLAPIIANLASTIIPPLVAMLANVANMVLSVVVPAITGFVKVLTGVLTPIINGLAPLIKTVFGFISATIGNVMNAISGVIKVVTGVIKGDWTQVWNGIKQVFSAVWSQIKNIASTAINLVKGIFQAGWNAVKSVTTSLLNSIVSFVSGIPGKITSGLSALGQLGAKAAQWFGQFLTAAQQKFGEAVNFVRGVPSKLVSALGNLSGLLVNSGKSLLTGLANGIKQGFSNAVSAVKNGLSNLRSYFPFSPAKLGPFSGSGYTTYSGKALARDFGDAIAGEADYLQRRAADLMRAAQLEGQVNVSASGLPGANSGRSVTQHITLQVPRDAFADVNTFMQFIAHLQRHAAAV